MMSPSASSRSEALTTVLWLAALTSVAAFAGALGGCTPAHTTSGSWGPVVVEAMPLSPRALLEIDVTGEDAGDLAPVLRAAVADARLGPTSTSSFLLSVTPRGRRAGVHGVQVARLQFTLSRDGARVAEDDVAASAGTMHEARQLAVARLIARASAALARQEGGGQQAASGLELPAIVVLERVAHSRDLLELSFVETLGGAVVRQEIVPLADAAAGPPGRFLLSRRTVEGRYLDDDAYDLLVKRARPFLDLRPIGDAYRVGYFGPRAEVSPAAPSPLQPRMSTPPGR